MVKVGNVSGWRRETKHNFIFNTLFSEIYELMFNYMIEPERQRMAIQNTACAWRAE